MYYGRWAISSRWDKCSKGKSVADGKKCSRRGKGAKNITVGAANRWENGAKNMAGGKIVVGGNFVSGGKGGLKM